MVENLILLFFSFSLGVLVGVLFVHILVISTLLKSNEELIKSIQEMKNLYK